MTIACMFIQHFYMDAIGFFLLYYSIAFETLTLSVFQFPLIFIVIFMLFTTIIKLTIYMKY